MTGLASRAACSERQLTGHPQKSGVADLCQPYGKRGNAQVYFTPKGTVRSQILLLLTLPPSSIQLERDSGFQFCPDGRVVQRGPARSWSWCAASDPVAGRRWRRIRLGSAIQGSNEGGQDCSHRTSRPAWRGHGPATGTGFSSAIRRAAARCPTCHIERSASRI